MKQQSHTKVHTAHTAAKPHINHHQKTHQATHAAAHHTFINGAVTAAKQSERLTGVPASVTIAQAVLESGWGAHHIGKANNYFGVKAHTIKGKITNGTIATGHVSTKTKEHVNGKNVTVVAQFRSYKSMADSFTDHSLFLKNEQRYHKHLVAYQKTGDANAFAKGLQSAGYATDPHYAKLLISIIKKHDLHKYDVTPAKKPKIK